MPHKQVVKEDATTTKVRMVFDASMKPRLMLNSANECMNIHWSTYSTTPVGYNGQNKG
jgi:hypothetical protein